MRIGTYHDDIWVLCRSDEWASVSGCSSGRWRLDHWRACRPGRRQLQVDHWSGSPWSPESNQVLTWFRKEVVAAGVPHGECWGLVCVDFLVPAGSGCRHLPGQSWCTRIHLPVSASVLQGVAMGDDDLPVDRWCPLNRHHKSVTWVSGSPKCALYESEPLAFRIRWIGLASRHLWRCLLRNLSPGHHEEQMGPIVPCEKPVPHQLWISLLIPSLWDIPIQARIDLGIHHRVSDNLVKGKHKARLRSQDVRLLHPSSWLDSLCFSVLKHCRQKSPESG